MNEQEFNQYLETLTAQNVTSEDTFRAALCADDPFVQEQRFIQLEARAKQLKVRKKQFDKLLSAFTRRLRDQKKADREATKAAEREERRQALAAFPDWAQGEYIDEPAFLDQFDMGKEYHCINGRLYKDDVGFIADDEVLSEIQKQVEPYYQQAINKKCRDLLNAMKSRCYMPAMVPNPNRVYFKNGYYDLEKGECFSETEKQFTFCRLNVEYSGKAPAPARWLEYLAALLNPEDIPTFQEFCGYAMAPTTRAQKMLFIIGNGGEGKSVAGNVLMTIFGAAATSGKLHDLEERFGLSTLEGKLLFIDDDLPTAALKESSNVKKIVTASTPVRVERKHIESYEVKLFCRLLCFGNQLTDSLYDHSNGAVRRRLVLTTRPKDPGRKDDPLLSDKIIKEELSGVVLWMLDGLKRLQTNNWQFTISENAARMAEEYQEDSFSVLAFLRDDTTVRLGNMNCAETSKDIYKVYLRWCDRNAMQPNAQRSLISYMKSNAKRLGVKASEHITDYWGNRSRGFFGVELLEKPEHATSPGDFAPL